MKASPRLALTLIGLGLICLVLIAACGTKGPLVQPSETEPVKSQ